MDTKNLLKIALQSLYKYPELQSALSKNSENSKNKLKIIKPLSKFLHLMNKLCMGTFFIAATSFIWGLLGLISIGLFQMIMNPYFLLYLIFLSALLFIVNLFISMTTFVVLNLLNNSVLKEFYISSSEEYLGNYPTDNEVFFNLLSTNQYFGVPQTQLSSITMDRTSIEYDFQSNGFLTEITNKKSNNKIILQLQIK